MGLVSGFGRDRGCVGFYGGVEGDDATGQVLPPAVGPAVVIDHGGELFLVGPLADGVG